jgi:NADH-quinone oxidoreductase subunit M
MLAWPIYISLFGALLAWLAPVDRPGQARWTALLAALAGLATALAGTQRFWNDGDMPEDVLVITQLSWLPTLGIEYFLGADGISVVLVLLTGIAAVAGILFCWNIEHRANEFFALFLALIGGVYGVFLSFDIFLLFVFYELAIIPKFFLVAVWGSTNKSYGAMKLVLYSFVGSALVLIGIVAAYVEAGMTTTNLVLLAQHEFSESFQLWAFPVTFIGFAVLAGLWPFHSWAPTGHVAAPTGASMLLAGVVMKLGAYGCLRVAMTLFPEGAIAWKWPMAVLAVIGIVYGATVSLVQRDFKFVIGYSSVSHMGFVMLGLATLTEIGLSGAVLQMFSHGIIAGLLFAVVGRMVYDRTHTRDLGDLEKMRLCEALPFVAVTFVLAGLASMGMPGFSGFVAELQVLIGAWQAFPSLALISGVGIVIGVAYTLRAVQRAFYSDAPAPDPSPAAHKEPLPPVTIPERIGTVLLLACTVLIGLFPGLLLELIVPSLGSTLFERMGLS